MDHPKRQRDAGEARFRQLDSNTDIERSIRRFDAAVDTSLKRIRGFIAEGAPPR
ncbi:hypothetical protein QM467_13865 [Rhodoblastus sp. 17X3]|uniref:hypothetical protein n=1 Tax=Rhodoblastus sp. 17X3 TaxID=3047026 RepID=UPI0024B78FD6|nr:hypothetical protein [Rhodoblastus sp. 17X3]MDI9849143.1 hypothetical protein [Rhodoblastus sp. 17X3]